MPLPAVGVGHTCDGAGGGIGEQRGDARAEMYLAAACQNGLAHGLDYFRQFVGADVRVHVHEYVDGCAVLAEPLQHGVDRPALLAAGVELAVGIGAGAALAETVVAVGVDDALAADAGHVDAARVDVLAALQHHRAHAQRDEAQCGEKAGGACAHDDGLRSIGRQPGKGGGCVQGHLRVYLVDVDGQREVDHHMAAARGGAASQHVDTLYARRTDAELAGCRSGQACRVVGHVRRGLQLYLVEHEVGCSVGW